jgi:hypothetical protein
MAVLSKISVGDIFYYTVDDIPSHVAPKGSVSIMVAELSVYNNGFTYVNNDGGSVWLKYIEPKYGEISLNGTTEVEMVADDTAWFAFNPNDTWTLNTNSHPDFILTTQDTTTDDLSYTGDTPMRAIVRQSSTIRCGITKWGSFSTGVAFNFTVPINYNEAFANDDSATTNIQSQHTLQILTNDYLLGGISVVSVEAGGGPSTRQRLSKYCQISAVKIDEPLILPTTGSTLIDETFESGNFTANSWTVTNDATNVWVVGTAESNGGIYSAYISNDGGTSASYTNTVAAIGHFYKDFTLPAGTNTLTFDWKCEAENAAGATQYDYGAVVITDTTTTPVAGTEVITTVATAGVNGRLGAGTNLGKFNLAYGTSPGTTWNTETIDLSSYSGTTKRIVFTWVDDTSVGIDPPFIVDNIKITNTGGGDTLIY